jgi:hypothetical protein
MLLQDHIVKQTNKLLFLQKNNSLHKIEYKIFIFNL